MRRSEVGLTSDGGGRVEEVYSWESVSKLEGWSKGMSCPCGGRSWGSAGHRAMFFLYDIWLHGEPVGAESL